MKKTSKRSQREGRLVRKADFINLLAEFLSGGDQALWSIRLGDPKDKDALMWAKLRSATPLFGYMTVDEAVECLTEFLG